MFIAWLKGLHLEGSC